MKRNLITALMILMLLVSGGILLYPTVSNLYNTYRQKILIDEHETIVATLKSEDYIKEWEKAEKYNSALNYNALYADVFENGELNLENTEYWNVLNVAGDGIMGYLSIPKIDIKLAIYHGAKEAIIQTGAGHISGTMLPIGEENIHSVLVSHRGLPRARLFTDIDQLQPGDKFYIHILNKEFTYEVDRVLDMVHKDDAEALAEAFSIEEGVSRVTLFTCTPYGINSHRLLVQGTLAEVQEAVEEEAVVPEESVSETRNSGSVYILSAAVIVVILIISLNRIKRHRKKK